MAQAYHRTVTLHGKSISSQNDACFGLIVLLLFCFILFHSFILFFLSAFLVFDNFTILFYVEAGRVTTYPGKRCLLGFSHVLS